MVPVVRVSGCWRCCGMMFIQEDRTPWFNAYFFGLHCLAFALINLRNLVS